MSRPLADKRFLALIAYFGRLESYSDLWRATAARNPEFDFLFIGDVRIPEEGRPANVRVEPMTVAQLEARVESALGVDYALARPYKLNDLRPAYGLVFHDLVAGYDYWGHCDTDVVFGRVQRFFPADWDRYDKIFPFGNLSFYRNDDRVNRAFMLDWDGPDWRSVLLSEKSWHFDEERGINRILVRHGLPLYETPINADIDFLHGRLQLYFEQDPPSQAFYWRDGGTFRVTQGPDGSLRTEEYAYIHFQQRPMVRRDFADLPAGGFWVVPDGFMAMAADSPVASDLEQFNWDIPGFLWRRRSRILRSKAKREVRRGLVALRRFGDRRRRGVAARSGRRG